MFLFCSIYIWRVSCVNVNRSIDFALLLRNLPLCPELVILNCPALLLENWGIEALKYWAWLGNGDVAPLICFVICSKPLGFDTGPMFPGPEINCLIKLTIRNLSVWGNYLRPKLEPTCAKIAGGAQRLLRGVLVEIRLPRTVTTILTIGIETIRIHCIWAHIWTHAWSHRSHIGVTHVGIAHASHCWTGTVGVGLSSTFLGHMHDGIGIGRHPPIRIHRIWCCWAGSL